MTSDTTESPEQLTQAFQPAQDAVERAFGAESRQQMLSEYFAAAGEIAPANTWQHVYRLLLWIDQRTGLAHCYDSDKAQPGRPWYARSLAFHGWLAGQLDCAPAELAGHIDWLFKRATERLAVASAQHPTRRAANVEMQRAPYHGQGFPDPGEDPELQTLLIEQISRWYDKPPPEEGVRLLAQRIRAYLMHENKRRNLLGEGFEDVLASIVHRLPGAVHLEVHTRRLLHDIPGFRAPRRGQKPRKVDLAIVNGTHRRILVSAKWSIRADREEQFGVDFEAYDDLEEAGSDFEYVLVTNEFDAARLIAACRRRRQNANLFTSVVHVNPRGPLIAYGTESRRSAALLPEQVRTGRLTSLEEWLTMLTE
jgi:hypothetical protein